MIIPKEIKQKPIEYILFLLILILGIFSYFFIDNAHIRILIVSLVSIFYFCWSIYHHKKRGDLQFSIIIEYILIILLGIVFLFGTLF